MVQHPVIFLKAPRLENAAQTDGFILHALAQQADVAVTEMCPVSLLNCFSGYHAKRSYLYCTTGGRASLLSWLQDVSAGILNCNML